jgi:hypothetical protein
LYIKGNAYLNKSITPFYSCDYFDVDKDYTTSVSDYIKTKLFCSSSSRLANYQRTYFLLKRYTIGQYNKDWTVDDIRKTIDELRVMMSDDEGMYQYYEK